VRTLRPAGPRHALIVVYDGQFFRGALTATIALRDGRTVTENLPPAPGELGSSPSQSSSLTTRLHSRETQLAQVRSNELRDHGAAHKVKVSPHRPIGASHGLVALLTAGIRVIRQRIAFERSHPGLLPAL
jgi:hypothetical protein